MSFEWLNEDSRTFLSRGYLQEGQSAEQRIREIADSAEKILGISGFADKFYEYMSRGYYSLSSPVWSNFGNNRGLPISCNGVYVDDTVSSILKKSAEVGMQTKHGAGTSGYFGDIRPRGSKIKTGGTADGPVHFMEIFETNTDVISQGSVRRGSFAAYLDIEHPDVEEFLEIREVGHAIQNLSLGLCISDAWMEQMIAEGEAVKAGTMNSADAKKLKLWARVMRKRKESGYPYLFFTDTVNNNKPQVLKDKNLKIHASNLCISGNDRVVSNHGYLTAKELYERGVELKLFDNTSVVSASEMKLREQDVDVYKIVLENGMEHTVTDYHKVMVRVDRDITKMVELKDLKIGDKVCIQNKTGIFGPKHMPREAFLLGLYQGDGTQHKERIFIDLWENDFDLIPEVEQSIEYIYNKYMSDNYHRPYPIPKFSEQKVNNGSVKKVRIGSTLLSRALNFEKGVIPNWIWEANEETLWEYIRGLFYSDGTVNITQSNGNPLYLSLASIDKAFLKNIQLILHNLGINCSIGVMKKAGMQELPDGKGGTKLYNTKTCYRLTFGNKKDALLFNKHTKFLDRKNIFIENRAYRDNTKKAFKIKEIIYAGKEDVYCPTVYTDKHVFISQGIITSNCSEIALPSSEDESFVCNLASMNILTYDSWKETDAVETMIYFLDAVMSEYIEKTSNIPFMEASCNFARRWRALGLGQLGWHSYLQSKMIAFESFQAMSLNAEIAKFMDARSSKATKELAEILGEPEGLVGYGVRNLTRLAIAPTTSSSFILGQVSPSIEPLRSNYFTKDLAKGSFTYKNPYLAKVLEEHNQNTDETWYSILTHKGSVQHLDFLSENEKLVFKTFDEIVPLTIVQQASTRQKYIDQSQSLNLLIPPTASIKDINALIIEGWRLGVKTFYYQRSSNPSQDLVIDIMNCVSCEA